MVAIYLTLQTLDSRVACHQWRRVASSALCEWLNVVYARAFQDISRMLVMLSERPGPFLLFFPSRESLN